jgi:single-strand DNA-binding protein
MNRIILLGRLTREPEVKVVGERTVTMFTLAVDRPFKSKNGGQDTDFINVVTWNKTAEIAGIYLHKGHRALVEGRLQIRSYDGKDGNKHYVTEVVADRLELIEKREKQQDPGAMGAFGSPTTQTFDEEVPF